MEQEFYKGRLAKQYGLEVLVPDALGRKVVHDVIYNELVAGKIEHSSRERYSGIITDMVERGGAPSNHIGVHRNNDVGFARR